MFILFFSVVFTVGILINIGVPEPIAVIIGLIGIPLLYYMLANLRNNEDT